MALAFRGLIRRPVYHGRRYHGRGYHACVVFGGHTWRRVYSGLGVVCCATQRVCVVPYSAIPCHTGPYRAIQCQTVPYSAIQCRTACMCCAVQCHTVPYKATQCQTVPNSAIHCRTMCMCCAIQWHTVPYRAMQGQTVPYSPIQGHAGSNSGVQCVRVNFIALVCCTIQYACGKPRRTPV